MKTSFIEVRPLFKNQELIECKTKRKIGHMPFWKTTTAVINVLLFFILYLIWKLTDFHITPETLALFILIEGIVCCFLLYIIAVIYANAVNRHMTYK